MGFGPLGGLGCTCCGSSPCTITIHVQDCSSVAVSGATVNIYNGGGTLLDSGTTNGSGDYVTTALTAGTYTVEVTKATYSTWIDSAAALTCGGTYTATISTSSLKQVVFTAITCPVSCPSTSPGLAGATLTIEGRSYTTNASGQVILNLTSGSHSYTLTHPKYDTLSSSFSVTLCTGTAVCLKPTMSAGYVCCGGHAISKTLYVTDANGTVTLNYTTVGGFPAWEPATCSAVSQNITVPASCVCGGSTATYYYIYVAQCNNGTAKIDLSQSTNYNTICGKFVSSTCDSNTGDDGTPYKVANAVCFRNSGAGTALSASTTDGVFTASGTLPLTAHFIGAGTTVTISE